MPTPFHVYSMRQAIEEKFILDVLQNYTPYQLAFKLAHNGQELNEAEVERSAAMKGIMGWVRLYVDKRLAGIQAVQTLSRLNRAHPGKDTTYVLDFVNDTEEVLASFKTYHTTAELSATTDPHLVYNLRAKLDGAGHYDDFEVDRVVAVALNPHARQSELISALEPVQDRIMKRYQTAQARHREAEGCGDPSASKAAQDELEALVLFKGDMGA